MRRVSAWKTHDWQVNVRQHFSQEIKLDWMEDFKYDEMTGRSVYGDRMHATELSIKDDEVLCPKACLLFYYTLKTTLSSQKEYILLGRSISRWIGMQHMCTFWVPPLNGWVENMRDSSYYCSLQPLAKKSSDDAKWRFFFPEKKYINLSSQWYEGGKHGNWKILQVF